MRSGEQTRENIIRQAAALQAAKRDFTTGLTLDEIRRVAAEAGIDPQFIEQAAAGAPLPVPVQAKPGFWGGRYRLERERLVDHEVDGEEWSEMVDVNFNALYHVTRAVLPGMVERGRGHVINIGSLAGHETYPGGSVYCATKAAVRTITTGLRLDLFGTPVRVTIVHPGLVETEFSVVRFHGDEERARKVYEGFTPLGGRDVADAVAYIASLPPHVNVLDIILVPTAQRNVYVVDRT